jgi:CubicO group peptidase (beta-lactamase class C family)
MPRRKVAVGLLWLALFLSTCQSAPEPLEPVVIDPAQLQIFADAFFADQMEALHIPGLVFILVQGGEVIYARGYGYANGQAAIPMEADSTVVRIGSVSKTLVATAVMQLVEAGELDLHTDVNEYLTAFQLEETFPQPVALAHLLTHTAGFEDPPYISNTDPLLVEPLGAHLAAHMPPRTHPPGKTFIYSNYGFALAALIVEEVSAMPFDQYVARNIFQPLGMTHSQYLVAPPIPETMATGYFYQDGEQIPQPMDYDSDYPGGSIVSTAEDMSRFMLAHLQGGCIQDACILQPATVAQMQQQQAETPYEGQNVTYGFTEGTIGNVRMLGHSGAIRGFGNSLDLLPEHDLGYFFSFNAECYQTSACQILSEFRQQFTERFFR